MDELKIAIANVEIQQSDNIQREDINDLARQYQVIANNIRPRYHVKFVNKKDDVYGSQNYEFKDSTKMLKIARDGDMLYVYTKGYCIRFILEKLLFFMFLESGFARIHGGGIQDIKTKNSVLLAGSGGVGKTTTILSLLEEKGNLAFMGDDIILVDSHGNMYPIFKKLNIYKYHTKMLDINIEKKKLLISSDLIHNIINRSISLTKRAFNVSYELPEYSIGWLGEYWITDINPNAPLGEPGTLKGAYYLYKAQEFSIAEISSDVVINKIINETIAEEVWGHVDKFYGIANEIFEMSPSLEMYRVLNNGFKKSKVALIGLPKLKKENYKDIIRKILHGISNVDE